MTAFLLSPEIAREVIDTLRKSKRNVASPLGGDRGGKTGPMWGFVKVTGNGSIIAGYPGVLLMPSSNNLFEPDATSEQIWIYPADTAIQLVPSQTYIGRLSGWDDARAKSTWQALPHCCDGPEPIGSPPGEIKCYQCTNAPPCLAVFVNDGFNWLGTVYIPLAVTGDRECRYRGTAVTPNATLTLDVGIAQGSFGSPSGSYANISGQGINHFGGGLSNFGRACGVWGGTGLFPLTFEDHLSSVGSYPPFFINAQPAADPGLCIGGGTNPPTPPGPPGGGGGGGVGCIPCDPAVPGPPCYNCGDGRFCSNAEACFTQNPFSGSSSCTPGTCGCGGTCGGSDAGGVSTLSSEFRYWSLVDYTNASDSVRLAPVTQNYADVGNVGAGEDDLYVNTIAANTLAMNGDSIRQEITFVIAASATGTPRIYFSGIKVYDAGVLGGGLGITVRKASVIITRATATTARATVSDLAGDTYTSETTLTGLNFLSPITLKATGQAGGGAANNDIRAVQSVVTKIPSSTTLTMLGVTPVPTVLTYGPDTQLTIPFSSGDYTGAGASTLDTGSASGTSDVDVYAVRTGTTTVGQLVRVFKEVAGAVVSVEAVVPIDPRTADAKDTEFQRPIYLCTVRITGTSEKIKLSKEINEATLLAKGRRKNYY